MLDMNEAKSQANKDLKSVAGLQFQSPTGAIGTILPELSERGKLQAEFTCTNTLKDGTACPNTHVREISDWHQSGKCRICKKSKSKGGGSTGSTVSDGGARMLKVLDTDTPEIRTMKEENNRLVAQIQEEEKKVREAVKAKEAAERKAKAEADKATKEAERIAKQKDEIAARLAKIRQVAAEKGVAVSAKTEQVEGTGEEAEAEELETEQAV